MEQDKILVSGGENQIQPIKESIYNIYGGVVQIAPNATTATQNIGGIADSAEQKKKESDETTIRLLMRHMYVPLMDDYFERGPARVKSKIFDMHDAWNDIIHASTFIIYDQRMSHLVHDFFDTWHDMVLSSVAHYEDSNTPGDVIFGQAEFDVFKNSQQRQDFDNLICSWYPLYVKFTAMMDCIKSKYVIDMEDVVIK